MRYERELFQLQAHEVRRLSILHMRPARSSGLQPRILQRLRRRRLTTPKAKEMNKVKIKIFIEGAKTTFIANSKVIANVWCDESSHVWRYRVEPTNCQNWTDRSQDTAINDVKHIITRELNRWGFLAEFVTM